MVGKAKPAAGRRGPRGRTGPPGARGPQGPAGPVNDDLLRLSSQVSEIAKELETQLTRIGQIQSQLDRLASGQSSARRDRRRTDKVEP